MIREDKAHYVTQISKWVDAKQVNLNEIEQVEALIYSVD